MGSVGDGGATIAVRSVRSGLPLRHLRHSLRLFLQIPSGASTRPAIPHRPRHALAMRLTHGLWGELCAWRVDATSRLGERFTGPVLKGLPGGLSGLTRCLASGRWRSRVWVTVLAFLWGLAWIGRSCVGRPSSAARAAIGGHPRGLAVGDAAARLRGAVGRGPPQTGRAGGLLRLTRCLAIGDDAIACGGGEIIFFEGVPAS